MKKRRLLFAMLLMTGTLVFAGCGDKKEPGNGKQRQEVTKEEQSGQEEGTTEEKVDSTVEQDDTVEEGSATEEDSQEEEVSNVIMDYSSQDYVTLGEYKGLEVECPAPSVSQEDVDQYIQETLDEYSEYKEVTDRKAQMGDSVNIDYTGTIDGSEFDGGSDVGYDVILGDEEFVKEFEESLVGVGVGETVNFSVTFPEDYWDDAVIGKTAEFTVTVNQIQEIIFPEYNDAFVSENTEYGTTAEFEESIKAELLEDGKEESKLEAMDGALLKAVENATLNDYPQEVYDICYADTVESFQFYAQMFEMEYEDFVDEYVGEGGVEEAVLGQVAETLVVQAIAEQEGFAVTEENYSEAANELAEEYGYETLEEFETDYGKTYIQMESMREKVKQFLYESSKLVEVPYDEYYGEEE